MTIALLVVAAVSTLFQWALGYFWHDRRTKAHKWANRLFVGVTVISLGLAVYQVYSKSQLSVTPDTFDVNVSKDWTILEFRVSNSSDEVRYGVWLEGRSPDDVKTGALQMTFDGRDWIPPTKWDVCDTVDPASCKEVEFTLPSSPEKEPQS